MPPMFRLLPLFFAPFLSPADSSAGGGGDDADTDADDQKDDANDRDDQGDDKLGDAGEKALKAEREARKKAEKDARDLKAKLDEIDADRQKHDEDEAKKNGQFEKIADERAKKIADLEAQLKDRDATEQKAAIAKKHGIPEDLVSLLQGETEDDIEASAKTIGKHLKVRESTEIDAGEKTVDEIRKKPTTDKKKFEDPARWGLRSR